MFHNYYGFSKNILNIVCPIYFKQTIAMFGVYNLLGVVFRSWQDFLQKKKCQHTLKGRRSTDSWNQEWVKGRTKRHFEVDECANTLAEQANKSLNWVFISYQIAHNNEEDHAVSTSKRKIELLCQNIHLFLQSSQNLLFQGQCYFDVTIASHTIPCAGFLVPRLRIWEVVSEAKNGT